ncbi:MAG: MauE/DoxX family redox-associated membrane protein [Flavitalea sp.]
MAAKKIFTEISIAMLIMMFTYAAASKLFIYDEYRFELLGHVLIKNYTGIIAWALPVSELFIVLVLLFESTRKIGLYASVGILTFFTAYIIYMFTFYPSTPCSCGGVISALSWKEHLLFNLFFIGLALTAIRFRQPTSLP